MAGDGELRPSLELGVRYESGDAEMGTGLEVGGGLRYSSAGSGVTVEARGRGLVASLGAFVAARESAGNPDRATVYMSDQSHSAHIRATRAEAYVRKSPVLELLNPASLGIVCFRINPGGANLGGEELEEINRNVLVRVFWEDRAFLSSTRLHGTFALRMCIINHNTTPPCGGPMRSSRGLRYDRRRYSSALPVAAALPRASIRRVSSTAWSEVPPLPDCLPPRPDR